jgi:hypothetical protein
MYQHLPLQDPPKFTQIGIFVWQPWRGKFLQRLFYFLPRANKIWRSAVDRCPDTFYEKFYFWQTQTFEPVL